MLAYSTIYVISFISWFMPFVLYFLMLNLSYWRVIECWNDWLTLLCTWRFVQSVAPMSLKHSAPMSLKHSAAPRPVPSTEASRRSSARLPAPAQQPTVDHQSRTVPRSTSTPAVPPSNNNNDLYITTNDTFDWTDDEWDDDEDDVDDKKMQVIVVIFTYVHPCMFFYCVLKIIVFFILLVFFMYVS